MKEILKAIVPDFMKFFSIGSSCGMAIAFGLSMWFEPIVIKWMFGAFLITALVGLYDIKDDFIEYFKE